MKPDHPEPTVAIRPEGLTTVIALAGQLRGTLSAAQRDCRDGNRDAVRREKV